MVKIFARWGVRCFTAYWGVLLYRWLSDSPLPPSLGWLGCRGRYIECHAQLSSPSECGRLYRSFKIFPPLLLAQNLHLFVWMSNITYKIGLMLLMCWLHEAATPLTAPHQGTWATLSNCSCCVHQVNNWGGILEFNFSHVIANRLLTYILFMVCHGLLK